MEIEDIIGDELSANVYKCTLNKLADSEKKDFVLIFKYEKNSKQVYEDIKSKLGICHTSKLSISSFTDMYEIKKAIIKIVDCVKYPFHYRKYFNLIINTKENPNNLVTYNKINDEADNQNTHRLDVNNESGNSAKPFNGLSVKLKYDTISKKWTLENRKDPKINMGDMDAKNAISQRNLNVIDYKKNKGLVGLTIKQKPMVDIDIITPNIKNIFIEEATKKSDQNAKMLNVTTIPDAENNKIDDIRIKDSKEYKKCSFKETMHKNSTENGLEKKDEIIHIKDTKLHSKQKSKNRKKNHKHRYKDTSSLVKNIKSKRDYDKPERKSKNNKLKQIEGNTNIEKIPEKPIELTGNSSSIKRKTVYDRPGPKCKKIKLNQIEGNTNIEKIPQKSIEQGNESSFISDLYLSSNTSGQDKKEAAKNKNSVNVVQSVSVSESEIIETENICPYRHKKLRFSPSTPTYDKCITNSVSNPKIDCNVKEKESLLDKTMIKDNNKPASDFNTKEKEKDSNKIALNNNNKSVHDAKENDCNVKERVNLSYKNKTYNNNKLVLGSKAKKKVSKKILNNNKSNPSFDFNAKKKETLSNKIITNNNNKLVRDFNTKEKKKAANINLIYDNDNSAPDCNVKEKEALSNKRMSNNYNKLNRNCNTKEKEFNNKVIIKNNQSAGNSDVKKQQIFSNKNMTKNNNRPSIDSNAKEDYSKKNTTKDNSESDCNENEKSTSEIVSNNKNESEVSKNSIDPPSSLVSCKENKTLESVSNSCLQTSSEFCLTKDANNNGGARELAPKIISDSNIVQSTKIDPVNFNPTEQNHQTNVSSSPRYCRNFTNHRCTETPKKYAYGFGQFRQQSLMDQNQYMHRFYSPIPRQYYMKNRPRFWQNVNFQPIENCHPNYNFNRFHRPSPTRTMISPPRYPFDGRQILSPPQIYRNPSPPYLNSVTNAYNTENMKNANQTITSDSGLKNMTDNNIKLCGINLADPRIPIKITDTGVNTMRNKNIPVINNTESVKIPNFRDINNKNVQIPNKSENLKSPYLKVTNINNKNVQIPNKLENLKRPHFENSNVFNNNDQLLQKPENLKIPYSADTNINNKNVQTPNKPENLKRPHVGDTNNSDKNDQSPYQTNKRHHVIDTINNEMLKISNTSENSKIRQIVDVNNGTKQTHEAKKQGLLSNNKYSPPILPSLSYDLMFYLMKFGNTVPFDINYNPDAEIPRHNDTNLELFTNETETVLDNIRENSKRRLSLDECNNKSYNVKKISLEEYKRRLSTTNKNDETLTKKREMK